METTRVTGQESFDLTAAKAQEHGVAPEDTKTQGQLQKIPSSPGSKKELAGALKQMSSGGKTASTAAKTLSHAEDEDFDQSFARMRSQSMPAQPLMSSSDAKIEEAGEQTAAAHSNTHKMVRYSGSNYSAVQMNPSTQAKIDPSNAFSHIYGLFGFEFPNHQYRRGTAAEGIYSALKNARIEKNVIVDVLLLIESILTETSKKSLIAAALLNIHALFSNASKKMMVGPALLEIANTLGKKDEMGSLLQELHSLISDPAKSDRAKEDLVADTLLLLHSFALKGPVKGEISSLQKEIHPAVKNPNNKKTVLEVLAKFRVKLPKISESGVVFNVLPCLRLIFPLLKSGAEAAQARFLEELAILTSLSDEQFNDNGGLDLVFSFAEKAHHYEQLANMIFERHKKAKTLYECVSILTALRLPAEDPNKLPDFCRGNSLAFKLAGLALQDQLLGNLKSIADSLLQQARVYKEEDQTAFQQMAETVLTKIFEIPITKDMLAQLAMRRDLIDREFGKKVGNLKELQQKGIIDLHFLRAINPYFSRYQIPDAEKVNFKEEEIVALKRCFVLLSKVLQTSANGLEFSDGTSLRLDYLNPLLRKMMKKREEFLAKILG